MHFGTALLRDYSCTLCRFVTLTISTGLPGPVANSTVSNATFCPTGLLRIFNTFYKRVALLTVTVMEVTAHSSSKLARTEPPSMRKALPSHPTISRNGSSRLSEHVTFNSASSVESTSPAAQSIGISSAGPSPSLNGSERLYSKSPSPFDIGQRETPTGTSPSPSPASAGQGGQVCRYVQLKCWCSW
jgi:hypothetical protein